jgi:hypothetical protein
VIFFLKKRQGKGKKKRGSIKKSHIHRIFLCFRCGTKKKKKKKEDSISDITPRGGKKQTTKTKGQQETMQRKTKTKKKGPKHPLEIE